MQLILSVVYNREITVSCFYRLKEGLRILVKIFRKYGNKMDLHLVKKIQFTRAAEITHTHAYIVTTVKSDIK